MVQALLQTIKTPLIRLWVSGQMNSTLYDDVEPKQLLHYDAEGIVDSDDNETDNDRPIFYPLLKKTLQTTSFLHYKQKCFSGHIRKIME